MMTSCSTRTRRLGALLAGLVTVLVAFGAAGCGSDGGSAVADLEFVDMWSRLPVEGQPNSAVYGTVTNGGDEDVRIVAASTDVTDVVELHITVMEDGLMSMREQPDGFVVPAGGSFVFEPGGPHVMFLDIDPQSYPTDAVDVTFEFAEGETAAFTAEVREFAGMGSMSHDMEHGDG